jgi:hypothetical protein
MCQLLAGTGTVEPEKRGRNMERRQPHAKAAARTPGPRGDSNMAARLGRMRRRTPLISDGRTIPRMEWNGNGGGGNSCC